MSYKTVKAILARIKIPEQLRQIELASPQIIGETVELWERFIQRDVENWREKNYRPSNPADWSTVYRKYMDEQKAKIDYDKEKLRQALAGIKKEQTNNLSKKVEARYMPKVPRDSRMRANDGGVPLGGRGGRSGNRVGAPGRRLPSVSTIGYAATGVKKRVNIVEKARREAAMAIAARRQGQAKVPDFRSQIRKAPAGMVNEYRKAAEVEKKKLSPRNSPVATGIPVPNAAMKDREARLRAIKASGTRKPPVQEQEPYLAPAQVLDFNTPSEDTRTSSANDDDDIEKLFGEYHERQLSATAKRKLHGNDYADPFTYRPSPVKPATKRTTDVPPEEWEAKLQERKSASPPVRSRQSSPNGTTGPPKNASPAKIQPKKIFRRPPPTDPFMTPKRPRRA
jgi:elongin-A